MTIERMNPDRDIEALPVIKNDLLRKSHVGYSMAWQYTIGPRQKVIYDDMGGDAATVLLFSNAKEIISTGGNPFNQYSKEYITKYWSFIDTKPIPHAGSMGYNEESFTAENFQPSLSDWKIFREDMLDRKRRGYWNRNRTSSLLGEDRLLLLELKKLGVEKDSIKITQHKNGSTDVIFDWAYPKENPISRKITYLPTSLDKAFDESEIIENADCLYLKGVSSDDAYSLLSRVPYHMKINKNVYVAVGYLFKINKHDLTNNAFRVGLNASLGGLFKPVEMDPFFDKLIDRLPEADPQFEENKYGMKMHVFERRPMPIRKYKSTGR